METNEVLKIAVLISLVLVLLVIFWQCIGGCFIAVTLFISFLHRKSQGWSPLFRSKGLPYGRKVEGHGGEGQKVNRTSDTENDATGRWSLSSRGC